MRGFVPTPPAVVDYMVDRLFRMRSPKLSDQVLDPGCGTGPFLDGIIRWCKRNATDLPHLIGIESQPGRARQAQIAYGPYSKIEIRQSDFLIDAVEKFDFIIGNPPYVPITRLSETEKTNFRASYETARGRFDLYLLFFERGEESQTRRTDGLHYAREISLRRDCCTVAPAFEQGSDRRDTVGQ